MSGRKIHKTHFTQPEMPWRKNKEEDVELKRELPIIFNAEMVRAILEGRKTQTRRVIRPQPKYDSFDHLGCGFTGLWAGWPESKDDIIWEARCPYGKPGDQLWVRETFAEICKLADPYCWCEYPSGEYNPDHYIEYRADTGNKYPGDWDDAGPEERAEYAPRWRPSIHMFRWMSRIQLEVLSVKVERVQDITEEDVIAEGIKGFLYQYGTAGGGWKRMAYPAFPDKEGGFSTARQAFEALWDSINKKRGFGWDVNPWVWVVEFKVIEVKNGQ